MDSIINAVLPVFAIILCGYLAGRFGVLGAESSEALNRFVYWIALPVLLFHSMARVEPDEILNWPFIGAFTGGLAITMALTIVMSMTVFRRKLAEAGLAGMTSVFGNTGYMGIPLAIAAFGEAARVPAVVAVIIPAVVIVPAAIACIEIGLSEGHRARIAGGVIAALARNPLVVSSFAGIAWSFSGLTLSIPIDRFCGILGAAAGPSALFAIGLFLVGIPIARGAPEVGVITVMKLIVHPLATWFFAAHVFSVSPEWTKVGIMMAAVPVGASAFVLAQNYRLYEQRSSTAILVSTVVSVLTLSALFTLGEL